MRIVVLSNVLEGRVKKVEGNLSDVTKSVVKALRSKGHRVKVVSVDTEIFRKLKKTKADLVFNVCERFNGSSLFEPHVAALLDMADVRYTGSDHLTLALCMKKDLVKRILMQNRIKTARFQVFETKDDKLDSSLRFPLIVKPHSMDNSIGISQNSVVGNVKELRRRVGYVIKRFVQHALVEEYIDGQEVDITVIGNKKLYTLPACGVAFGKNEKILDYKMKWLRNWYTNNPLVCPAKISNKMYRKLSGIAIRAHKLLRLRDYSRVDFRIKKGVPYVIEVNPNPGLSEDCFIRNSAKAAGISYPELIQRIINAASERYKNV